MKNDGLILMKSLVVYFHNDPNTPACIGYEAWLDSLDQGAESLKNIIDKNNDVYICWPNIDTGNRPGKKFLNSLKKAKFTIEPAKILYSGGKLFFFVYGFCKLIFSVIFL